MSNIFNTSVMGLSAFRSGLATTAHNIANANTEGYSRQRVDLAASPPLPRGYGFVGQGVVITDISRIADQFMNQQVQFASSETGRLNAFNEFIVQVENLLADDLTGLSGSIGNFFNAVSELSDNPGSGATRSVMLNEANALANRFAQLNGQVDQLSKGVNSRLTEYVNDINTITSNIADLNQKIVIAKGQAGGKPPGDLMDQRDQLITQLSEIVSIATPQQSDGSINVFVGSGQALVLGTESRALAAASDPGDPDQVRISYDSSNGLVNIIKEIGGGSLGGVLDFNREVLSGVRNELGRAAIVLANSFNREHVKGMDLRGDLGVEFFHEAVPDIYPNQDNTGSATVNATVTDVSGLTSSDYELAYDGADYTLTRLNDGASVSGPGPLAMDGVRLDITGSAASGDKFQLRPTRQGARDMAVRISDADKIAAGTPVRTEVQLENSGKGKISAGEVLDAADPNLLDTIEIRFKNPPTDFDIVNVTSGTTVVADVAYSESGAIDVAGKRVVITGAPDPGDVFTISHNTAGILDNRNALRLQDLQTQSLVGGTQSYQEGYGTLVSSIGVTSRQTQLNVEAQSRLLNQAQEARDAVSGVNLDEEAVNLAKYQKAYQAAAQAIATADTLFQTLLSAIRR